MDAANRLGLQHFEPPSTDVEVWPEHWTAVQVFAAMATQWSVGMAGPVGLRYESLPVVMRMLAVPRAQQAEAFEQIRMMEAAALEAFAERRSHG